MGQDAVVCPWDVGGESEEEDEEWMFSSIKLYKHLYMFNVNLSPSCMVTSPDNKCVALADRTKGHLEVYRLPGKLVAASREEEGLTSNRDFGLVSGSVQCAGVSSVQYLDTASLVTTSSDSVEVSVWGWDQGDDLIQRQETLCSCDFQPRGLELGEQGAESVTVYGDQHVGRSYRGDRRLDSRPMSGDGVVTSVLTSDNVTLVCDDRSTVTTVDWRMSAPASQVRLNIDTWLCRAQFIMRDDRVMLVTLDTCGQLRLWDTRGKDTSPLCSTSVGSDVTCLSVGSDNVSVSQGSAVAVYDVSSLERRFEHKGHTSHVTGVFTHPNIDNLVISTDIKHNLHAWVYH